MTPFQVVRLWARRAPFGERLAAASAAAVVIALLAWLVVPGSGSGSAGSAALLQSTPGAAALSTPGPRITSPPAAAGHPLTGGGFAPGTAVTATARPVGAPGPRVPSAGTGKACLAGSATGVSSSRIKLAVLLVSLAGPAGNGAFGIPAPAKQKAYYQAAIDEVNAHGGVACRQLTAQYYEANPADQNDLQQKCLTIVDAGVFAVLDAGVYAQFPLVDCYAQHKIPYFGSYLLSGARQRAGYPYLFDFNLLDTVYRDAILALRDRGFFTSANGFSKLGFIYHDCDSSLVNRFEGWLAQSGVTSSKLVTYSVGCPTGLASPSSLQQGILKFKQAGVTHLTSLGFVGDFASFTTIAQQQGFRPKYGLADDAIVPLSYGTQPPDPDNIDGAIAITGGRAGEDTTPGSVPTAGTARCNAALKREGLGPVYSPHAAIGGNACSNVWMFAAAASHAGSLARDALASGLQAAGSLDLSFPAGPNDFTVAGTTTAGQYWRPLAFRKACRCWQVIDRAFHHTYP